MDIKKILENKTLKFSLFVAFLFVCFAFGKIFKFDLDSMREFLSAFPIIVSGVIFILLYVVLTFFIWFGPKDVFRLSSAVLFGAYVSTVLVWIAEMINAAVLFIFSRKLGQEFIEQKFRVKKSRSNRQIKVQDFLDHLF